MNKYLVRKEHSHPKITVQLTSFKNFATFASGNAISNVVNYKYDYFKTL